jgi:hypothetical protein
MKPRRTPCVFLELLAVLLAHGHHRRHVHFVERGQDGVFVLRLQQALGNAGTQAGHRHALFRTIAQADSHGRGRQCGLGSGRSSHRTGLRCSCNGIGLGDTTTTTRAGNVGSRHAFLVEDLARSGHRHTDGRGCCCRRRSSSCGLRGFGLRRNCTGLGRGVDLGDHFTRDDGLTVTLDDFNQHAAIRGRQLKHDLVGLDVDQVFVTSNGLAGLLVPGNEGGLGHGLGQLRNFDVDDHVLSVLCAGVSTRSCPVRTR